MVVRDLRVSKPLPSDFEWKINKLLLFSFDQLGEISFHTISTIIVYRIQSIRKSFKCKHDLIVCSCWLIEELAPCLQRYQSDEEQEAAGILFVVAEASFNRYLETE